MKKIIALIVAGALTVGAQGRTALNPEISVILDTFYYTLQGAGEGNDSEDAPDKGFNLRSAEFFVTSPVDPYFRFTATIPVEEEGVELEEAFVTSVAGGLNWKLGKFRSAFGRLNRQHPHFWDFADSPLIFRELLGGEGLTEKGVQVSLPFGGKDYWALGAELLQGENASAFGDLAKEGPHAYHLFLEHSRDLSQDLTYLVTLSYLRADFAMSQDSEDWKGKVNPLVAVTLTLRSIPPARAKYTGWILQAEWLNRRIKRRLTEPLFVDYDIPVAPITRRVDSGEYAQFIYRFDRRWRAGVRWDGTDLEPAFEEKGADGFTVMADYSPSEFSRIRAQWTRTRIGGTDTNEYFLQFQFGVGPHAPHPF